VIASNPAFFTDVQSAMTYLSLVFIGVGFLTTLFFWFLRRFERAHRVALGLLTALGVLFFFRAHVFLWNIGQIDGSAIDWSSYRLGGIAEIVLWAIMSIVFVSVSLRNNHSYVIRSLPAHLSIVALSIAGVTVATTPEPFLSRSNTASVDLDGSFSLHPEKNSLVFVLDTFQADLFQEIVSEYPNEVRFLKGFDFYPDTIGGYPTTRHSISMLLSSNFYKNDFEWTNENIAIANSDAMPEQFLKQNFGVRGNFYFSPFPNQSEENIINASAINVKRFGVPVSHLRALDAGLLRAAPMVTKKKVFDDGNWLLSRQRLQGQKIPYQNLADIDLIDGFLQDSKVNSSKDGEFKLFYLWGLHTPLVFDENLKSKGSVEPSRENYVKQARGILKLMKKAVNHLIKLGVYDSTEIFIVSDHGSRALAPIDLEGDVSAKFNPIMAGSARPLFLHKPMGLSRGDLSVSNQEMHLAWMQCLSSLLTPPSCEDFKTAKSGQSVSRSFFNYGWTDSDWRSNYSPTMREYLVMGDSRKAESWVDTGILYESPESVKAKNIDFGSLVTFGSSSPSLGILRDGWYEAEASYVWSAGSKSELLLDFDRIPKQDLQINLVGLGYSADSIAGQRISVSVDGSPIGEFEVGNQSKNNLVIVPKEQIRSSVLRLTLSISKPVVPCESNGTPDCRSLGFAIQAVEVIPI